MSLPLLLLTFTLLSTLQLATSSVSEPIKGQWLLSDMKTSNQSICCPFANLTIKPDVSSSRGDMIGTFAFAPEFDSRCTMTRFANYSSKGFEISVSGRGDYGSATIRYYTSYYWTESYSFRFQTYDHDEQKLTVEYADYNSSRDPWKIPCEYTMIKVEDSLDKSEAFPLLELFKEAAPWKICLMALVLFFGVCLACSKTKYKAEAMKVEEGMIQKYQSPHQVDVHQPDHSSYQNMNQRHY